MGLHDVWVYDGNWLVLHLEYVFPWDFSFRALGFGSAGDYHELFVYNYGHLFLWFDQILGTYRRTIQYAPKTFNSGT